MTKEEFKKWGLFQRPKISPMRIVRYRVLQAAGTSDAEDYRPYEEDEE